MTQLALFENSQLPIPGLRYEQDFISRQTELMLLAEIARLDFRPAQYKQFTARRRIVSFGSSYDFSNNELQPAPVLPDFLAPLRLRVAQRIGISPDQIVHAMIAAYSPGDTLGWHRDVPNFEIVAGISLQGRGRMRFRPYPHVRGARRKAIALDLEPRSAYVLRDAARWQWQHSVPPAQALRYSITFRTAREHYTLANSGL
jgi:alkylated DNA repair dioxygenase AlkB